VVQPINKLLETLKFDLVCYSCDWHPADHVSFVDNVNLRKLDKSSQVKSL
jgi:exosome complex component RRP4